MLDLSAIRAEAAKDLEVEAKATPGPWECCGGYCYKCDGWHLEGPPDVGGTGVTIKLRDRCEQIGDLQAVTHARNTLRSRCETILALADEIERLREELRK